MSSENRTKSKDFFFFFSKFSFVKQILFPILFFILGSSFYTDAYRIQSAIHNLPRTSELCGVTTWRGFKNHSRNPHLKSIDIRKNVIHLVKDGTMTTSYETKELKTDRDCPFTLPYLATSNNQTIPRAQQDFVEDLFPIIFRSHFSFVS